MNLLRVTVTLAALTVCLTGCSDSSDLGPGYQDHLDDRDDYQQSEEYLQAEAEQRRSEDFAASGWSCYWAPTMNDDWHDDYECSNGVDYDRPYLLQDDSFVERWEIDDAAADYEASLNQ